MVLTRDGKAFTLNWNFCTHLPDFVNQKIGPG